MREWGSAGLGFRAQQHCVPGVSFGQVTCLPGGSFSLSMNIGVRWPILSNKKKEPADNFTK